jgi:DNA-binding transcriptional LysR family regulator
VDARQLRHFVAVARRLHFGRAAVDLQMAASPLSRSIQQLEREIGGPLFRRGTRSVELTELGASLLPRAERILADLSTTLEAMRNEASGAPHLTVGIRSISATVLRSFLDDVVRAASPLARITLQPLESEAQIEELLRGRLSLGLVLRNALAPSDPRLRFWPISSERTAIALPDRMPFLDLDEVRPEDLAELIYLAPPGFEPQSPQIARYRDACRDVLPIDSTVIGAVAALIATGDYCCLVPADPSAPWHRDLTGEGIVIRALPATVPPSTTYLVWRAERDTPTDLGRVIDAARRRFALPS